MASVSADDGIILPRTPVDSKSVRRVSSSGKKVNFSHEVKIVEFQTPKKEKKKEDSSDDEWDADLNLSGLVSGSPEEKRPGGRRPHESVVRFAQLGDLVRMQQCIEKGKRQEDFDPNYCDEFDKSALMYASSQGFTDIVEELLKLPGIDVNLAKKYVGTTALHFCKNAEIAKQLLESGANPHASRHDGKDCIEWNRKKGRKDVVKTISRHLGISSDDCVDESNDAPPSFFYDFMSGASQPQIDRRTKRARMGPRSCARCVMSACACMLRIFVPGVIAYEVMTGDDDIHRTAEDDSEEEVELTAVSLS